MAEPEKNEHSEEQFDDLSLEELLRNLRYGNFADIGRAIRLRVAKWTGRWHHS